MLAGNFFVKLLLAAGVFFLVRSMEIDSRKIVFVLMMAAVIQSGIGIAQFLSQSTFASTLLGMSTHEAWQAGTSVLKTDAGRWLRAYGTFPHPNILGGFLAAIFVVSVGYTLPSVEALKRNQRIFLVAGTIITLLGLLLTFSRSAWFGVALGVAVMLFSL